MRNIISKLTTSSLILISSCQAEKSKENLIGTWTLRNVVNTTKDSIIDKTIFDKNGNVFYKFFVNGQIQDSMKGEYSISKDNNYLTIKIESSLAQKFEITKLTKTSLELSSAPEGKKKIDKFEKTD